MKGDLPVAANASKKFKPEADQKIADLVAEAEKLEQERLKVLDQLRHNAEKRAEAVLERECEIWGVTPEQWYEAKNQAEAHRRAKSQLDAAMSRLAKLEGYGKDERFGQEDRDAFAQEAEGLKAKVPELEEAAKKAEAESLPFSQHLAVVRRQSVKGRRADVQQATAQPVNGGVGARQTE